MQQNFKQYFNILRILHLALNAAVIAFAVVIHFVMLPSSGLKPAGSSDLLVYIAAGYMTFAISLGYWLFGSQLKTAKAATSLSDKLNTYRSANIIRWALLEGAALMALVFYFVSGKILLVAIAGVALLLLGLLHPTQMRLKEDLDLSQTELDRLDDPQDLVVQPSLIKRF